ncbi:hypothetical protein D3C71_1674900 [compost metagenome]
MGADAGFTQDQFDLARHALDSAAVLQLQRLQTALDGDARRGVQMLERQFLQLGGD